MLKATLTDSDFSQERLDSIMSRRRLTFNPYTLSDKRLLDLVLSTGWGNEIDIVQTVILHFTRLRPVSNFRKFDGIYFRIGNSKQEYFMYVGALINSVTANDSLQGVRSTYGSRVLRNREDEERLVGCTAFVSHLIRGKDINGNEKVAYRMHPLRGSLSKQANKIREALIESKIEMFERILSYPGNPDLLSCKPGLIDYEFRIRRAIEIIRNYPLTPIP